MKYEILHQESHIGLEDPTQRFLSHHLPSLPNSSTAKRSFSGKCYQKNSNCLQFPHSNISD